MAPEGVRSQRYAPAAFTPGKDLIPIVQEAGWVPGPAWTVAENLAPHRDSIPGPSTPLPVVLPTTLPGSRNEPSGGVKNMKQILNIMNC